MTEYDTVKRADGYFIRMMFLPGSFVEKIRTNVNLPSSGGRVDMTVPDIRFLTNWKAKFSKHEQVKSLTIAVDRVDITFAKTAWQLKVDIRFVTYHSVKTSKHEQARGLYKFLSMIKNIYIKRYWAVNFLVP